MTVTNAGNSTWPSSGYYRVDLEFHFTTQTGDSAKRAFWLTNQAHSMPEPSRPGTV